MTDTGTTLTVVDAPPRPAIRSDVADLNVEQTRILRETVARDCNDAQFAFFMEVVRRCQLDPFQRQIHAVIRHSRRNVNGTWIDDPQLTIQTGIDGFRNIAERTDDYGAGPAPVYGPACECRRYGVQHPEYAVAAVRRWHGKAGQWAVTEDVAYFDEFVQTDKQGLASNLWMKMPRVMLSKCAEARALRRAFPSTFSGLYLHEEMEQASNDRGDHAHDRPEERGPAYSPPTQRVIEGRASPALAPEVAQETLGGCPEPDCDGRLVRDTTKKGKVHVRCTNNVWNDPTSTCGFVDWAPDFAAYMLKAKGLSPLPAEQLRGGTDDMPRKERLDLIGVEVKSLVGAVTTADPLLIRTLAGFGCTIVGTDDAPAVRGLSKLGPGALKALHEALTGLDDADPDEADAVRDGVVDPDDIPF